MRKKMVAILMIAGVMLGTWAETETVNGIKWMYWVSEDKASISSSDPYDSAISIYTSGAITIPSTLGGYPVTSIGDYAFYNCHSLTSVTIPNSVTSIGEWAFSGCSSLTSVTIPNSVTSIGECAFSGCSSLTSVTIPNSITSIGDYAFSGCSSLTTVTILNSVTRIGGCAFLRCSSLTSVTFGDSVTSIGEGAFRYCSSLTSVAIPNSVMNIGEGAFYDCGSLTSVAIPQSVCDEKMKDIFPHSYQSITKITIADGVTTISSNCFMNCKALPVVIIPASVTRIGAEAFYDCVNLEKIIFKGDAPFLGENAFAGTPRRMTVQVPAGSIGWNGGVSTDLPETWGDRIILYFGNYNPPSGGGNSGDGTVISSDVRYSLSNDVEDRTIANVEIEKDGKIDEFVLKDGKVYDCVIRIVNVSDKETKITLPVGYEYETIGDISPLVLPAKSKSILTITRTAPNTFLVVRQPLSSIQ